MAKKNLTETLFGLFMSTITNTLKNVQQWQSEFSLYFVNKGNILNCAEEDPIKKNLRA